MDELYELVEKDYVNNLALENTKLKEQVQKQFNELKNLHTNSNSKLIAEIIDVFNEQSKKEREFIIVGLNEIKEINKSTLDNVIVKTQNLDVRLEDMIKTIQELIMSVSELTEELKKKDDNVKNLLEDFSKTIQNKNQDNNMTNDIIKKKLTDIEKFLNNLKNLLSQIRPADLTINENNFK